MADDTISDCVNGLVPHVRPVVESLIRKILVQAIDTLPRFRHEVCGR